MPPRKKDDQEKQENPAIPLAMLPPEVVVLKEGMPLRLYVLGEKRGDTFIITSSELDRR